jgi:predicted permease
VARLPIDPAFRATLALDWTALGAALGLAVVSGSAIALVPMRHLLRGRIAEGALTDRSKGSGVQASRTQNVLVVAEVLLAVVLLTGASLLIRTVGELRSLDPGLDTENVLALDVLVGEDELSEAERTNFFDELLVRAGAIPGVTSAGYTSRVPLRDGGYQGPVTIPDRPDLAGPARPNAMFRSMTSGTFAALGMEVVQGRGIEATDGPGAPTIVVVNETFARKIWGDENPLGRTYLSGFTGEVEVVGVVRDIAVTDLVGEQPMVGFYSWDQTVRGAPYGVLLLKTGTDPLSFAGPLRALVRQLEPRAAVGRVETMAQILDSEMAEPLRLRFFLGLFSALGVVLGSVGVYGVVSYSVQRRRTEFGIRLALGADPGRVLAEVVRAGMLPVGVGVVAGAAVAFFASRAVAACLSSRRETRG